MTAVKIYHRYLKKSEQEGKPFMFYCIFYIYKKWNDIKIITCYSFEYMVICIQLKSVTDPGISFVGALESSRSNKFGFDYDSKRVRVKVIG